VPERLRHLLESRRVIAVSVLLGVLLSSSSLFGGLQTEDWVFRSVAKAEVFSLPWRVNFWGPDGRPSDELVAKIVNDSKHQGTLPWLTDETFHVSLWRPLGSLFHHLDYRVWPDLPFVMHLQSLAWYGLLVFAAVLFYRRVLEPRWVAGLAAIAYAVDDAHGHPVGWITNRSAVMAALFAVLALTAFDRWRRDGWRPGVVLTPLGFGLGLLSSELALGAVGYFVAYGFLLDRAGWRGRLLAALVWLTPLVGWGVAYRLLGHGATGSGLYFDPLTQPLGFMISTAERASVLAIAQIGFPPSDLHNELARPAQIGLAIAAILALLVLLRLSWPILRTNRALAFLALGMALAIVPACSVFPQDRMLLLAGIGGSGLVAGLLGEIVTRVANGAGRRRRMLLAGAGALVLVHFVVAAMLLPFRSLTMWRYEKRLAAARESAFALVDNPNQELVLLNAPDFYFGVMLFLTRAARAEQLPWLTLVLNGSLDRMRIVRLDTNTLELTPEGGFLSEPFNRIYRDPSHPLKPGALFWFDGYQVRVLAVDAAGNPTKARFRFRWALQHRRIVFGVYRNGRYERAHLPEYGQSMELVP
jgi:hypothetical protein